MKKTTLIFSTLLVTATLTAQQIPLSESYFLDKYSLSPSYAGNFNTRYLFTGYRSDWTGIKGGPKTFRISFNDRLMSNSGYGVKAIFDKAGIFNQLYFMGTYSYNLKINEENHLLFGLSAGLYRNSINMVEYYNDPDYNIDPSLVSEDINSKIKFMSDASVTWIWKGLEAGFMFTNINFGDAHYSNPNTRFKPLANFQFHSSCLWNLSEKWDLVPLAIVRGGKYIKSQFEIATQVLYQKKIWGNLVFRDPGIWGVGFGANIDKGFKISYNFNFASYVALNIFTGHEISLGINIFEYTKQK